MSNRNVQDRLLLANPSGKDPKGNSALPGKTREDAIAIGYSEAEATRRLKELEKNVGDLEKVVEEQDRTRTVKPLTKVKHAKAPTQKGHIAHAGSHRAVAIEPDLCLVGKCVIAFNSYSVLPDETAGSHNVKAIGTRVLREGDLIKGVQADAGKNIATGTSLCDGYLAILEGHRNVKSNGARVALHNSLCRINTNDSAAVGPLARMMTMVKPVASGQAPPDDQPPPGKRTSAKLEALKAELEAKREGMLDFDTSDENFRFNELAESMHDLIEVVNGQPGTLADHGAQAVRAGLGFVADIGIGISEIAYEGIKLVPKTLQSKLTPSGIDAAMLENAILVENLRLGNITTGTIGEKAIDIGAALVKPVTEPWISGQRTEASVRGAIEILSLPLTGWTKAGRAKKAADALKAAEALKTAEALKAAKAAEEVAKASAVSRNDGIANAVHPESQASATAGEGVYVQGRPTGMEAVEIPDVNGAIKGDMAGSAPLTNPGYPVSGRIDNCVNCAVATDATFAGRPASALPHFDAGGLPISEIPKALGLDAKFSEVRTFDELTSIFSEFGPASRGVVFADRGPGQVGHVFNVVVDQRGAVKFWDGQTMTRPVVEGRGYKNFWWIRSN